MSGAGDDSRVGQVVAGNVRGIEAAQVCHAVYVAHAAIAAQVHGDTQRSRGGVREVVDVVVARDTIILTGERLRIRTSALDSAAEHTPGLSRVAAKN